MLRNYFYTNNKFQDDMYEQINWKRTHLLLAEVPDEAMMKALSTTALQRIY